MHSIIISILCFSVSSAFASKYKYKAGDHFEDSGNCNESRFFQTPVSTFSFSYADIKEPCSITASFPKFKGFKYIFTMRVPYFWTFDYGINYEDILKNMEIAHKNPKKSNCHRGYTNTLRITRTEYVFSEMKGAECHIVLQSIEDPIGLVTMLYNGSYPHLNRDLAADMLDHRKITIVVQAIENCGGNSRRGSEIVGPHVPGEPHFKSAPKCIYHFTLDKSCYSAIKWKLFNMGGNSNFECSYATLGYSYEDNGSIVEKKIPCYSKQFKHVPTLYLPSSKFNITFVGTRPGSTEFELPFKAMVTCVPQDRTIECDHACAQISGWRSFCIGRRRSDCLKCQVAQYEDECVESCKSESAYKDPNLPYCTECDHACATCDGPGKDNCTSYCPESKFVTKEEKVTIDVFQGRIVTYVYECHNECPRNKSVAFKNTTKGAVTDKMCLKECPDGFIPEIYTDDFLHMSYTLCIPKPQSQILQTLLIFCVIGSVTIVFLVILCILMYCIIHKYQKSQRRKAEEKRQFYVGEGQKSKVKANMNELRFIKTSDVKKFELLGHGAFGTVYRGLWTPADDPKIRIPVAIKELHGSSKETSLELINEASNMVTLDNQYLLKIVAVCMSEPMMLITKLMPYGNSLTFLKNNKQKVTAFQLLEWSRQLAAGMAHLKEQHVVHRDLAARNVLVDSPRNIRISDFGLSKVLDFNRDETSYVAEDNKFPIRWLAPECFESRTFTHESDVWALAVTVWEFYTFGEKPYGDSKLAEVPGLIRSGYRLVRPPICSVVLYAQTMVECWLQAPASRPSFDSLAERFEKMRTHPSSYIEMEFRNIPANISMKDRMKMANEIQARQQDLNGQRASVSTDLVEHNDSSLPHDQMPEDDEYMIPQPSGIEQINFKDYRKLPPIQLSGKSVESNDIPGSIEESERKQIFQQQFPGVVTDKIVDADDFLKQSQFSNYADVDDAGDNPEYMNRNVAARKSKRWRDRLMRRNTQEALNPPTAAYDPKKDRVDVGNDLDEEYMQPTPIESHV